MSLRKNTERPWYVVLFRGINVGGRNILPMKDLKLILEESGFYNVKTYIQSGNVVLQGEQKPTEEIATKIEAKFGFKPKLLVLDTSEFESSIKNNPYHPAQGKSAHVLFCSENPTPDFDKINSLMAPSEEYVLKGKVFYLHAPDGIGRSRLAAKVESCLGVPATGRNLNTMNKIHEMLKNA